MALEVRLVLKQQQRLIMTQTLQQAIKLLPMTRLELVQRIQQELVENPLLEELLEEEDSMSEGPEPTDVPEEAAESGTEGDEVSDLTTMEPEWELLAQANDDSGFPLEPFEEKPSFENTVKKDVSLFDHLLWQLSVTWRSDEEKRAGAIIIGNLDANGYLAGEIEEIAAQAGISVQELERVLRLVQSLEPTGVAARDLQECMLLQVRNGTPEGEVAERIVSGCLEDLTAGRVGRIARSVKAPMELVHKAIRLIRTLDPFPGRSFTDAPTEYITPDLTVIKVGGQYRVILNDDDIPRLHISRYYRKLLKDPADGGTRAKEYLEERLRSAVWLIKGIEQRRQTLLKVGNSIVEFQRDFLDYGLVYLRPLVLRDVADDIEMHESTVSRVTTNKYIETPQGLLELKYFFHSRLDCAEGEGMSSVRVKDLIKKKVSDETPSSPYTDEDLACYLRQHGVRIARRTIAKYRKELGIPSSSRRKKMSTFV